MALLFRNDATRAIPSPLMYLSSCSGIWLKPELLLALNAWFIVFVSSAGVMCCTSLFAIGMYPSSGIVVS